MEVPKRDLFFCKKINEENVKDLVEDIIKVNVYDDEQFQKNNNYERKPIKIYFSTNGGSVEVGLSLYNYIKYSNTPVWIYVSGYCYSAGIWIILGAEKVFAYKETSFMYHQISYSNDGNSLQDNGEYFNWVKKDQERLYNLITNNTKIPLDKLKYIDERKIDWYIDVNEAKELEIIDDII